MAYPTEKDLRKIHEDFKVSSVVGNIMLTNNKCYRKGFMARGHDMVDAFGYCIQSLEAEKVAREKRHKLIMILMVFGAIALGSFIGWLMQ